MLTQLVGWNLEYNVMHPIRNQYQEMNNSRVMENNDKIQKKKYIKTFIFFHFRVALSWLAQLVHFLEFLAFFYVDMT